MGAARGSALSASAIREVPVFEYTPYRVKQAVVGFGRASKEQMSKTLMQMLNLPEALPYDESDALGLAPCHALTTATFLARFFSKGTTLRAASFGIGLSINECYFDE